MHRLLAVKEEGEVEEEVVYQELLAEMRQSVRTVTTVASLRYLALTPYVAVVDRVKEGLGVKRKKKS